MGYINDRGEFIRSGSTGCSGCLGWFITIMFILGVIGYCSDQTPTKSTRSRRNNPPPVQLSYRSSCGSPARNSSRWYAVVGSKSAYSVVKNKYCGDSFIRKDGYLQVASFTSRQEAQNFANKLSQVTGYRFSVR